MKKIILGLISFALMFSFAGFADAATTIVVSPGNMQGWGFAPDSGTPGTGQMVNGPATPPVGTGSAQMTATISSDRFMLGTIAHNNTKLSDITSLKYSTYRDTGGAALAIALQFNIDTDITDGNTSWQGRLVYEPYYTQTVLDDTWQTWDTLPDSGGGNWWFSGAPGNATCSIGNPCTWNEMISAFPNAGIHATLGATLFKVGGGWVGFNGNVDEFVIGINGNETIYDFEPQSDNDGVDESIDKCPGTTAPDNFLGWNKSQGRYKWNGSIWQVSGKGANGFMPDMTYTYGCSATQILNKMSAVTGGDFGGHYKYGITKGLLETWHEGKYYIGPTFLETVVVDSSLIGGSNSTNILDDETTYFLKVSGTWTNRPGEIVDAKYTTMDSWLTNSDAPQGGYPEDLLDLQVNEEFLDWGIYNSSHIYEINYSPSIDGVLNFRVFDGDVNTNTPNAGWYGDNVGILNVDIVEDKWIDLW